MREKPLQVREILDDLPESWLEMDGLPEFYIARIHGTLDKGLLWDQPLLHPRTPMKLTVCNYSLVRFMPYPIPRNLSISGWYCIALRSCFLGLR